MNLPLRCTTCSRRFLVLMRPCDRSPLAWRFRGLRGLWIHGKIYEHLWSMFQKLRRELGESEKVKMYMEGLGCFTWIQVSKVCEDLALANG
jgi:hypothetical protein